MSNDSQAAHLYFWAHIKELTKDVQVDLDEPLSDNKDYGAMEDYCRWDIKNANKVYNTLHKVEQMTNVEPKDMLYVVVEKGTHTTTAYCHIHRKEESRVAAMNFMHCSDYVFLINPDLTYTVVKTLEGFDFTGPGTLKCPKELYKYLMWQGMNVVSLL